MSKQHSSSIKHTIKNPIAALLRPAFKPNPLSADAPLAPLIETFSKLPNHAPNIYTASDNSFHFHLSEKATAYGKSDTEIQSANIQLNEATQKPGITHEFSAEPIQKYGLNFAASMTIQHGKKQGVILIPGERSYDVYGITGDPHASERIGGDCFLTQASITLAQLKAKQLGFSHQSVDAIQKEAMGIVTQFHGRVMLSEWMRHQVYCAFEGIEPIPYPEFHTFLSAWMENSTSATADYAAHLPQDYTDLLNDKDYQPIVKEHLARHSAHNPHWAHGREFLKDYHANVEHAIAPYAYIKKAVDKDMANPTEHIRLTHEEKSLSNDYQSLANEQSNLDKKMQTFSERFTKFDKDRLSLHSETLTSLGFSDEDKKSLAALEKDKFSGLSQR